MLTLQNLDLDTHVKLKKNEILEKELQFYNSALNTISTSSAVLAGFAFSGLAMSLEYTESEERKIYRTLFTISSTICVALNLITLCAATFASLFSVRLALRGSGDSVEKSVKCVRGEYKFVLFLFCLGIFAFFLSISFMGFYKYHDAEAYSMMAIGILGIITVGFLMRRASNKFYLSKSQRYLSNKEMRQASLHKGGERQSAEQRQQQLNPEEGVPYTRMNHSLTESQRRRSAQNGGSGRSGSLFGNIANSFMGGSERGLGSKRDSKKEVVAQTEGGGETDV
ncbi:hypothetical protein TrVE_jg4160 [Triparma verrucosa]|uniref:Uncharacterized protein n=1 Tax=Triparma verrucosa TaxID=1606542 RepID=A0A9W7BHD7_9STRA|nr:hypothetical protein TrVE_jg4160 [Triparma verrucosa]|mmetsp:Transcript_28716/g.54220  ORF Transcript_28716/g.54220 Transcript_28716/m.54220 type:complete len:282 (+) Transcript_28716:158-1003(+)